MYEKYPGHEVSPVDYATLRMERETEAPKLQLVNAVWLVKAAGLPLRFKGLSDRKAVKRAALLFGNSVCCPSCTYNKKLIGDQLFESDFGFTWTGTISTRWHAAPAGLSAPRGL